MKVTSVYEYSIGILVLPRPNFSSKCSVDRWSESFSLFGRPFTPTERYVNLAPRDKEAHSRR